MKPSSFQTAIRLQFDCLVKRVIDTTVKDGHLSADFIIRPPVNTF